MAAELTRFDNTTRLMGMSNSLFNTNDLVEAELQILDLQAEPKRNQKTLLTEEQAVWKNFKTDFSALTEAFTNLRFFKMGEKEVSYSKEGVVSFKADTTAQQGEYSLKVNKLAEKQQIAGADMGTTDEALGKEDTVKLNGVELEITSDMSLRDIVNKINGGSYNASASIISNRLVLTSKETGSQNQLSLEDGANGSLESLGLLNSDGTFANELRAAQDAEFSINGISLTSSTNSISDAIEGVTIDLKNTSTEEVRISVDSNKEASIKAVEEMITAYNKAVMQFQKYTEKGTYLQGQSIPLNVRREMTQISSFSSETGSYLFQYGIEVDGTAKDGTLKFDKTKLEKMYDENPEKFESMFFGQKGLGKYMEEKMLRYTGETGTISGKIDGLQKSIDSIDESLEQFEQYYENQKNTILNKYAAFESTLAGLNSTMDYMTAQLSSLTGSSKKD